MHSLPIFSHDFEKSRILNSVQSAEFIGLSVPHFRRLYRCGKAPKPTGRREEIRLARGRSCCLACYSRWGDR
jgi:hypothetical protein